MKNYKKLDILKQSKSVCILTHVNPDADALCSTVVLRHFLKSYYKIPKVDIFAESLNIPNNYLIILGKVKINKPISSYQTAIMMDSPNLERLGIYKELFAHAKNKIVIDHHSTNDYSGDINIVENVSSTCEIVYSILKYFKFEISKENQGKLYAGLITDTNNFTVGNITPSTFKTASELTENINRELIYNNFLANNTLKNMQLLSLAIQNSVTFEHGQIIISHISHEESKKYKANFDDFYGIINKLATINTAKFICFIKPKDNLYYVGMRGRQGANVATIAKNNGGGGHVGAAAFTSDKSLQEIEQLILTSFRKELLNTPIINEKVF